MIEQSVGNVSDSGSCWNPETIDRKNNICVQIKGEESKSVLYYNCRIGSLTIHLVNFLTRIGGYERPSLMMHELAKMIKKMSAHAGSHMEVDRNDTFDGTDDHGHWTFDIDRHTWTTDLEEFRGRTLSMREADKYVGREHPRVIRAQILTEADE